MRTILLTLFSTLILVAGMARAEAPENSISGSGVGAPGFYCETCQANMEGGTLEKKKNPDRWDSLLPDGNGVAPEVKDETAKGVGG